MKRGRPIERPQWTLWVQIHEELATLLDEMLITPKHESISLTYGGTATTLKKRLIKLQNLAEQIEENQDA
jgi:hypothetical protein